MTSFWLSQRECVNEPEILAKSRLKIFIGVVDIQIMRVKELTQGEQEDRQEETELRDTTHRQMLIKYEIKIVAHKSCIHQVPT